MGLISPTKSMWKAIEASTSSRGTLDWRLKTASMRKFIHGKYLESLKPTPTAKGYSPDTSWQQRLQPGQYKEFEPRKHLFASIKTIEGETALK